MILTFQSARQNSQVSFVSGGNTSYESETLDQDRTSIDRSIVMSRDELGRIRQMNSTDFEQAFEHQIKTENKEALLSLYYMKEAYRRRDWSKSYSSFNRYCVAKIKMSDSDFYRKYALMKTIEELPEIEEKILDGTLNQSTVSKVIRFVNKEARLKQKPINTETKRDLFEQIENKTEKQVERELAILSPEAALPDKTKQISHNSFLNQYTSDQALEDKFERLKEIFAHSFQGQPTKCEFLHKLADIALEHHDPKRKDERKLERDKKKAEAILKIEDLKITTHEDGAVTAKQFIDESGSVDSNADLLKTESINQAAALHQDGEALRRKTPASDVAPAWVRRAVRLRDHYRCTHIDPLTGEKCGSRFATEFDHIIPRADGGQHTVENMRLVCRTHNQLYALQRFGREKMGRYMESVR